MPVEVKAGLLDKSGMPYTLRHSLPALLMSCPRPGRVAAPRLERRLMMADRRVADSLCFRKAASGSRSFHKCTTISEQPRCFVDEEVGVAANGLPVGLRHDFRQYVTAVACAAARGELDSGEDIMSPVATQPDVWELRYPYEAPLSGNKGSLRQYRMYYAEDEVRGCIVIPSQRDRESFGCRAA